MDSYRTISRPAVSEFTEKRSRFLGAVCPVDNEKDAIKFINQRRKEYWDAKHNVYAYVLRNEQIQRYSDDGEPQGTAGVPVLDILLKECLTDCVVVVTRYFGGVLLGTGGLVRAYSQGAKLAVDAGGFVIMRLCARGVISCEYKQYGPVAALISECCGVIKDTVFSQQVDIEFNIPCELLNSMQAKLGDLSSGSLTINIIGEEYVPFEK
ncbi:MAG TPA: YigZ family protein [Ruminococcaceae bacterium]|nr:YigZ family protein [Oscillospiraceae bacterium]